MFYRHISNGNEWAKVSFPQGRVPPTGSIVNMTCTSNTTVRSLKETNLPPADIHGEIIPRDKADQFIYDPHIDIYIRYPGRVLFTWGTQTISSVGGSSANDAAQDAAIEANALEIETRGDVPWIRLAQDTQLNLHDFRRGLFKASVEHDAPGPITITLPDGLPEGTEIYVSRLSEVEGDDVIIATQGSQTVEGDTTGTLDVPMVAKLQLRGTDYQQVTL